MTVSLQALRRLLLLAAVALIILVALPNTGAQSQDSRLDHDQALAALTASDEVLSDSEAADHLSSLEFGRFVADPIVVNHLSETYGITASMAEYEARLESVASSVEIAFRRSNPDFSYLHVDHDLSTITIGMRENRRVSELEQTVALQEYSEAIIFVNEPWSHSDLQRDYEALIAELIQADLQRVVDVEADPTTWTLSIFVTAASREAVEDFVHTPDLQSLSMSIEVEPVEQLAESAATIIGGKKFSAGTSCTFAFAVKNVGAGTWTRGVLTAAHCGNDGSTPDNNFEFGGVILPFRGATQAGRIDAQVHSKTPSNTTKNRLRYHSTPTTWVYVDVTSVSSWSGQSVGNTVCQNGRISPVIKCGQITNKNVSPSYVPGSNNFIRATYDVCIGDSGASVWKSNSAHGIHSGGAGSILGTCSNGENHRSDGIYGAINYATDNLDVEVLTN